jgi:uncharacterized protein (TIGR02145 family)
VVQKNRIMKTLNKFLFPALALTAIAYLLACQKLDFSTVTKSNIQNVTVRDASTVKVEMQIFDLSDDAHPDYGVCYSETNQLPTVADSKVAKGAPGIIKTDSIILQGLQPGSKIYIRAFVMNGSEPQYSFNVKDATLPMLPSTATLAATNITQTAATLNGTVNASNNTTTVIFEYGTTTAYGQTINATPDTVTGTENTNVTASLAALQPNTSYHYRVKASCANGTSFGNDNTFATTEVALPVVTTAGVTNITTISATSGGNITGDGGSAVIARGVCWATSLNPTIAGSHTTNGNGTGTWVSELAGLTPYTTYFVRAYATNSAGTAYGNELQFTTDVGQMPTVTTATITNITTTTASGGGNVTDQGATPVTARGVCWSLQQLPTLQDGHTTDGTGTGSFTSNLTDLLPATVYFVRAYATNSAGTSYGNQVQFTSDAGATPTVTTANITNITTTTATGGGNVTVQGTTEVTTRGICWSTTQNPTITNSHTSDGTGTGAFTSNLTNLSPATIYYVRAYATNAAGISYGNQVQFTTSVSQTPTVTTTNITNISTTTATGGGNVIAQGMTAVTVRGVCWSTTQNPTIANNHTSDGTGTGVFISNLTGLSPATIYYVRAYATNTAGTAYGSQVQFTTSAGQTPTVTTTTITNITTTTATGGGYVTAQGTTAVTARGVCWSTSQNPTITNSLTSNGSGIGAFTSNITGLSPATIYYVRGYATNSAGTAYGNQVNFTTLTQITCGEIVNYSGQNYNTILIGTQCWFKENLNVGIRVNGGNNQINNGTIEKYCYEDNVANCNAYGGLYQWDEMMQYTTTSGTQGICPLGWHIPSDQEWTILTTFLGGLSVAGGKLKETGTIHWAFPNTGATNSSGFTALPSGVRISFGSFFELGSNAYFWSSTEDDGSFAWSRNLKNENINVSRYNNDKTNGNSVRCIKDN